MKICVPLLLALALAWAAMLLGCDGPRADPSIAVTKEVDVLYQTYLHGNRDQARRSLEETIQLVDKAKLTPAGAADCLCFTYARLYGLEKRAGREALAEAALIKARYWYLRQRELGGSSVDEAAAAAMSFDSAKCLAFIEKWDKDHNDGRGPMYLQHQ